MKPETTIRFELQRRYHFIEGAANEWVRESIALARSLKTAREEKRTAQREDPRGEYRIVRVTTKREVVR